MTIGGRISNSVSGRGARRTPSSWIWMRKLVLVFAWAKSGNDIRQAKADRQRQRQFDRQTLTSHGELTSLDVYWRKSRLPWQTRETVPTVPHRLWELFQSTAHTRKPTLAYSFFNNIVTHIFTPYTVLIHLNFMLGSNIISVYIMLVVLVYYTNYMLIIPTVILLKNVFTDSWVKITLD